VALIFNNDGLAFTANTDNPASFTLLGGRYDFATSATFSGGNIGVQVLMPDGTTYLAVHTALTAAGTVVLDLCPGTYKINIVTATSVQAFLVRVPYRAA